MARAFAGLAAVLIAGALATGAHAQSSPVGERHLTAHNPTAALRDADHKTDVRVTVWYPAPQGVTEQSLDLGPPGNPLFYVGSAALDAPFVDGRRRPVILFSHGFGGTARMMGWFTTCLLYTSDAADEEHRLALRPEVQRLLLGAPGGGVPDRDPHLRLVVGVAQGRGRVGGDQVALADRVVVGPGGAGQGQGRRGGGEEGQKTHAAWRSFGIVAGP